MSLDFPTLAAWFTGATAVGAAIGASLAIGRKGFKAEQTLNETVPALSAALAAQSVQMLAHERNDVDRFDTMERGHAVIVGKIDVMANDIAWIKGELRSTRK